MHDDLEQCVFSLQQSIYDPALLASAFRNNESLMGSEELKNLLNETLLNVDHEYLEQLLYQKSNVSNLISIPVKFRKSITNALLDTGASLNYMSEDYFYTTLTEKIQKELLPVNIKVEAANGMTIEAIGMITVGVVIQKRFIDVNFVVLKKVSKPLILGLKFCSNNGIVIDTSNKTMHFGKKETCLSLANETSLPAYSEVYVDVAPNCAVRREFWAHGYSAIQSRFGIFTAFGKVSRSKPIVKIANLSPKDIILPAGTIVAMAGKIPNDWKEVEPLADLTNINKATELNQIEDSKVEELDKIPLAPINETEIANILNSLDIDKTNLNTDQVIQIKALIWEFKHIFVKTDRKLKQTTLVKHRIDTGHSRPVHSNPYRTNLKNKEIVQGIIQSHLDNNFIQPSHSPWASPIVLVSKKDGSIRFCIDYRKLNAVTVRDVYPLPRIDDCLSALQGNMFFSTFDMCSGYNQVSLHPDDQPKSAFITDNGLYEWLVMPFGMSNAPATFQRLMDAVFAGLKWKTLLVYIDDIIVYSPDFDSHLISLREVFMRMSDSQLSFKSSKCHLLQSKVKYLGHVVDRDGIYPDPEKTLAISQLPVPKNVEKLRTFLGMSGYYRKFVPNYAKLCAPMYALTKIGVSFEWNSEHQNAYKTVQQLLISKPILAHPNYNYTFILQTDASDQGLGAVLTQYIDGKEYVIMYLSRVLQPCEKKWTTQEKEALGVVWGIQSVRPYVLGTKFIVETDHASLKWLFTATKPARIVRWALELSEYDFTIVHRSGLANANADALSRMTYDLATLSSSQFEEIDLNPQEFLEAQRNDPAMQEAVEDCEQNQQISTCNKYVLIDKILHERRPDGRELLLVPPDMRIKILKAFHSNNMLVHINWDRMYALVNKRFYWPTMFGDIKSYVKACLTCNRIKPTNPKSNGLLVPIRTSRPLEMVCVDILGPLTLSKNNYKYILTCVDHFTSWVEAILLVGITAEEVANAFFRLIILRHGCPEKLLSDQGTQFTSNIMADLCKTFNIQHLFSSS